jgi:hypothetical protein
MATETALDKAVAAAVAENPQPTVETPKVETKTEVKEEPKVEEPKVSRFKDVPEETISNALQLVNALSDPKQSREIIAVLAQRAGLQVAQQETAPKQATKTVLDALKEDVDPQFHYLLEALAPAITKLVKSEAENITKPIQMSMEERVRVETEREIEMEMKDLQSRHSDAKELMAEMDKISKRVNMGKDTTMKDYLEDLYTIASKGRVEAKTVEKTVGKINRNAKEVLPSSTEVDETTVRKGSKLPSIDEAVRAGFRNERLI